jgi:ligand-binding SRPBCC domain-containing protein
MSWPHHLRRTQVIARPRDEVFAFFADATNLERITPPELKFRILTPTPIDLREGTLIDYRLSLFGLTFGWRTKITAWQPSEGFVDEQLRGPYAEWVHTHRFEPVPEGTRMIDHVRYRLPLFPFGEAAAPVVGWQVGRIFDYRARVIEEVFR